MGFMDWMFGKDAEQKELKREDTQLQNGQQYRDMANSGYNAAGSRQAPQAGRTQLANAQTGNAARIDQNPQGQFRQGQMQLAQQLSQQAQGKGPSVAGAQFKAATDANLAQQQALAAGARGGGAAMAGRQAAQNASNFNQQAAQGAAIGRMQEQQAAQQALGTLLGQGRQSDIGLATSQAGYDQEMGIANMNAQNQFALNQGSMDQALKIANMNSQLQQTGYNDAAQQNYLSALTGMDQAELNARMQQDQLNVGQRAPAEEGMFGDLLSAGGTLGAAAIMASDKNLKTKKKKVSTDSDVKLKPLAKVGENYSKAADVIDKGMGNSKSGAVKAAGAIASAILNKKATDKREAEGKQRKEFFGSLEKLDNETDRAMSKTKEMALKLKNEEERQRRVNAKTMSDEDEKKEISSADKKVEEFLSNVHAYEYEYKDPDKWGKGKHLSPMAQDLEKSELGKEMVVDTDEGKMVNYGKGLGTIVASIAHLDKKLKKLEKKKGK